MFSLCGNRQYRQLIELIERKHQQLMSTITDFAAKVEANFTLVKTGITNLDTQIQNFNPLTGRSRKGFAQQQRKERDDTGSNQSIGE